MKSKLQFMVLISTTHARSGPRAKQLKRHVFMQVDLNLLGSQVPGEISEIDFTQQKGYAV
jgi:hypothetical protein